MALVNTQYNGAIGFAMLASQLGSVGTAVSVVATASPGTSIVSSDFNAANIGLIQVHLICSMLQLVNTSASAVLVTLQEASAAPPGAAFGSYVTIGTVRLGATGTAFDQVAFPVWINFAGVFTTGTVVLAAFAGTTAVVNATALGTFLVGNAAGVV